MSNEFDLLQGAWKFAELEVEGATMAPAVIQASRILVAGRRFTTIAMGAEFGGTLELNSVATPNTLDLLFEDGPHAGLVSPGIYTLEGDQWRICLAFAGGARPERFATERGSGTALELLTRDYNYSPAAAESIPAPADGVPDVAVDPAIAELGGRWTMVSGTVDGGTVPTEYVKTGVRVVHGNRLTVTFGGQKVIDARISVNTTTRPRQMDYVFQGGPGIGTTMLGIYELSNDIFQSCFASPGMPRPDEFNSVLGDGRTLTRWKRAAD